MISCLSSFIFQEQESVLDVLPKEFLSLFSAENGSPTMPDIPHFFSYLIGKMAKIAENSGSSWGALLATVILCGIFSSFESCMEKGKGKTALQLCIFIAGGLTLSSVLSSALPDAGAHLKTLSSFISALIPVLTALTVSMGGINSAAVSATGFSMVTGLLGEIINALLLPLMKASFMFEVCGVLCENKGLKSFSSTVKKTYMIFLGAITTVMLTLFSFQSMIAAKSDSLALRAFRYTAGNVIPMVGQAISESSKTLFAGVDLMRTTSGGIAIAVILLMLLPLFFKLLLSKLSLDIAVSAAKASENDLLASLLSCGSSLLGGICALIALSDLLTVLSLAVFMLTSSGGG